MTQFVHGGVTVMVERAEVPRENEDTYGGRGGGLGRRRVGDTGCYGEKKRGVRSLVHMISE